MKNLILLAGVACCWSSLPAVAGECTDLASFPATISAPGKYCLAGDVTVNSNSIKAITVNSNDVTVDCQGHTLKNLAASDNGISVGVYLSGRNNVVIRNCRIVGGFTNGIHASQDNNVANKNYYIDIKDNYIAGPYHHGIWAWGSAIEITGNRVYDIGGQRNRDGIGIRVGGSSVGFRLHTVMDNFVAGTNSSYRNAFGIYSDDSLGGIFVRNGVVGSSGQDGFGGYGLRIGGSFNRVTDNHVTGSGQANDKGIWATDDTTSCYDNYLRTTTATINCDASLGNY